MVSVDYDVIIVGAGPVGGRAATLLAERGMRVLMLEEHAEIGRPFQCAGLVTPCSSRCRSLRYGSRGSGWRTDSRPQWHPCSRWHRGDIATYVVCRKRFDQFVVQQGMEAGSHLWLETVPIAADVDEEGVELTVRRGNEELSLRCTLLIGADGAHSWTRRAFKMGHPKELMIGFQTEVVGYQGRDRWLEMYSGSSIAPGFFAWVIPSGFGTHRIGLWSTADRLNGRSIESCYQDLIDHPLWKDRFEGISEVARYCGPVPSGMVKRPLKDRVMLLGDAAGMAKPTTGGGIGPGFHQIQCIIDPLVDAIQRNDVSLKSLSLQSQKNHGMR